MENTDLVFQIMVLFGCATAVATVFHYLRIPTIVGFILSGMFVGPYGLGIVSNIPGVSAITEIGLSLLMFTIGLEFSSKRIKELSKSLVGLGLGMIGGVICLTVLVGTIFNLWSVEKSIAIGMVLSLSSSAIVLKILQSNRELETPFGNATVGILLAQDLAFVPMVLSLPILFGSGFESSENVYWVKKLFYIGLASGGLWIFTKYILSFVIEKIMKTRSNELFFFMLFFILAFIATGTHFLIGSITLGAFLAGVVLATSPISKQALSDVLPLRDVFLGLLFTSVGMLVDVSIFVKKWHILLTLTALIFLVKPAIVYMLGRSQNYSRNVSLVSALITFQVGEFSIVMIKEISRKNFFNTDEVQLLLAISVITMGLTPVIYSLAPFLASTYGKLRSSRGRWTGKIEIGDNEEADASGHTIIIGYGVAGQALGNSLASLGVRYVAIEMNFDTVTKYKKFGIPIIFGDASRFEILHSAKLTAAKMVIITVPSLIAAKTILLSVKKFRPDIEIVVRAQYERGYEELKKFGGIEIVVAEYELTLELLSKALDSYGLRSNEIRDHLQKTRDALDDGMASRLGTARNSIKLPGWEASALIRPYKLADDTFAAGKSLKELQIPMQTGVSVATVFREGIGTTVPHADFKLESGDIIHLVGGKDAISKADNLMTHGNIESEEIE